MVEMKVRSKDIHLLRQWCIQKRKKSILYQLEHMHHLHHLYIHLDILMELRLNLGGMFHFHCCGIRYRKLLELTREHSFHTRQFFVQMGSSLLLVDWLNQ